MPVNITDDELDIFNKNGFSDEDVKTTIDNYRSQGLDDNTIRQKIDSRLNEWNTPQEPIKANVTKNYVQNWDKNGNLYYTDEDGNVIKDKAPIVQRVTNNVKAFGTNLQRRFNNPTQEELKKDQNKAIFIGSSLLPVGIGVQATSKAASVIKPIVGKKIAENIARGAGGGLVGGGLYGGLDAFSEEKNVPLGVVSGGALGLLGGGLVGGALGNVSKFVDGRRLSKLPTTTRADKRVVKMNGDQYYKDYIQSTSVKRNDLGKINFDSVGGRETKIQQPEQMVNFPELKNNIKNAEYIGAEDKVHYDPKIKMMHRLRNGNEDYLIAETNKGKKYYISKENNVNSVQSTPAETSDALNAINSIIPDNTENFNPVQLTLDFSEKGNRGLQQTVAKAKGTPQEVKDIIKNDLPQYSVIHNNELTDKAIKDIESNFSNELSRLTSAKEFEALDYEKSRQIAKRLFDAGRHEEAINLIDNVSENATKKGQAIQALSLWSNMTPEGAVFKAEKLIKEFNKKVPARKQIKLTEENINQIRELQNTALNATDDLEKTQGFARTAKYISELVPKNIGQKLKAYRNISLLLNPKTLGRNIIGNSLFNAVDTVSKAAAVPIDRAIGLVTKNKTRVLPQIDELIKGGMRGAKTGFQEALEGIDTRGLGQRFDLQSGRTFKNPVMRGLESALDVGLRVPDRTQYEATFAESVANMMKAQGLEKPTQEILEQAEKEALESVFQNDSAISGLTTKARRAINTIGTKDFGLGDLAIPYAQTPANLVQQAINYSPLGAIKGVNNLTQGNQRQAALDLARALVGTGIIGSGYELSKTGAMTPSQFSDNYQKNKTIKANLETLGIKPETINGLWYAPFQPVSTSLAIGNAMANGENPVQAGLNTMLDLPFLQNVNRGLADIKDKGIAQAGVNFASSLPAQFVPTVGSQIGQMIDPYQRETYDPNILKQGLNRAIAKIPVVSESLPEKIDVTGQPIERYDSKGLQKAVDVFLNPTYINTPKTDATMEELKRIYDETGETSQFLPVVDKKIKFKDLKGNEIKKELTGKELSEYQKQVGTINKQLLDDLVQTGLYNNLDDENKIKLINSVQKYAQDYVDEKLFNKPSVQKRAIVKRLLEDEKDKIIREVLKMYRNEILPIKTNVVYRENF